MGSDGHRASVFEICAGDDDPRPHPEPAGQLPLQIGVCGFQHPHGEVHSRATRNGRLLGMTRMLRSPNPFLMGGNFKTEIEGYMTPAGSGAALSQIGSYTEGKCECNDLWPMAAPTTPSTTQGRGARRHGRTMP